jgi:hypothetical protein
MPNRCEIAALPLGICCGIAALTLYTLYARCAMTGQLLRDQCAIINRSRFQSLHICREIAVSRWASLLKSLRNAPQSPCNRCAFCVKSLPNRCQIATKLQPNRCQTAVLSLGIRGAIAAPLMCTRCNNALQSLYARCAMTGQLLRDQCAIINRSRFQSLHICREIVVKSLGEPSSVAAQCPAIAMQSLCILCEIAATSLPNHYKIAAKSLPNPRAFASKSLPNRCAFDVQSLYYRNAVACSRCVMTVQLLRDQCAVSKRSRFIRSVIAAHLPPNRCEVAGRARASLKSLRNVPQSPCNRCAVGVKSLPNCCQIAGNSLRNRCAFGVQSPHYHFTVAVR